VAELERKRAKAREAKRRSRTRRRAREAGSREGASDEPGSSSTPAPASVATQRTEEGRVREEESTPLTDKEERQAYQDMVGGWSKDRLDDELKLASSVSELAEQQMRDSECRMLARHLQSGEVVLPKKLQRIVGWCEWHAGLLFVHPGLEKSKHTEQTRRLWAPEPIRSATVELLHEVMGHMHAATHERVTRQWYWPGMGTHIRRIIAQCECCQRRDGVRGLATAGQIPALAIGREWAIDFCGPFKVTKRGNRNICLITDRGSRFASAFATKQQNSTTVIRCIRAVIAWIGVPDTIRSDHATCFTSAQYRQFLRKMYIKQEVGSPYHQSSNGLSERLNEEVYKVITKWSESIDMEWDELMDILNVILRNRPHSTTGLSPTYVLMGLNPRLPGEPPHLFDESARIPLSERDEKVALARKVALDELFKDAVEQEIRRNNGRPVPEKLMPGDQVLVSVRNSLLGQRAKFAYRYVGPLTVSRPHGEAHYGVLDKRGREFKVRRDEVKPYVEGEEKKSNVGSVQQLHWELKEWSRQQGEGVMDLPHINPTFAEGRG
jgi:transposase InsO family protein